MATIEDILGGGIPAGLLTQVEEAQATERAKNLGLLNLAFGMLQASRGAPGQGKPGLGQIIGQAGPVGMQAYQQSFDDTLKRALQGMQISEMRRKQQEAEQRKALLPSVFQFSREPATTRVLPAETGDITETIPGAVTGVKIDPTRLQALMMLPGGIEDVKGIAEAQKLLRQAGLGAGGMEAPSPFAPYLEAQSPQVKTLAKQLDQAFKSGIITEETAYQRLEPLAKMEESFQKAQGGPREAMKDELSIRSAFRDEPIYKAHQEMKSAYGQITEGINKKSPAGDLAAATKFMKLLDPGSVVRESELMMAMKASGALDRATNYASMVLNGQKLTETQRKDFQELANNLYRTSVNSFNAKHDEYAGIAKGYRLDVNRAVGSKAEFSLPEAPSTTETPEKSLSGLRKMLLQNPPFPGSRK